MLRYIFTLVLLATFFMNGCDSKPKIDKRQFDVMMNKMASDKQFAQRYNNSEYKELYKHIRALVSYSNDLNNYRTSISKEHGITNIGEGMLCIRATEVTHTSAWAIKYIADMVLLYTSSQPSPDFEYSGFKELIEDALMQLNQRGAEINSIITSSNKPGYEMTFSGIQNEIKNSKLTVESLIESLDNQYGH